MASSNERVDEPTRIDTEVDGGKAIELLAMLAAAVKDYETLTIMITVANP